MSGRFAVNLGVEQFARQCSQLTKPMRDVQRQLGRWQRIYDKLLAESKIVAKFLVDSGWPPQLDFPAKGLNKLADLFEAGKINDVGLREVFAEFYDPDQIDVMLSRWSSNKHVSHRMHTLPDGK